MTKLRTDSKPHLLNATVSGNGPVVVLLHGFLANSRYWERVRQTLSQDYTVVAIDLLGFGNSPKPVRSRYDYEAHISSIDLTLRKLSITEPFILVGHSMGSLISLRYGNTHPEMVQKLVLVNMPIMLTPEEVKSEIYSSNVARYGLHPLVQYVMWGALRTVIKFRLLPGMVKSALNEHSDYFMQHSGFSRVRSFNNVIVNGTVEEDLKKVSVQTTMLAGKRDRAVYMQNLASLVLPQNVALEVFDTTHHIPILMPDLLRKFLNK